MRSDPIQRLNDAFFMLRVETSTAIAVLKEFEKNWAAAAPIPPK